MVTATTTWAPLIEKHTIGYVPPEDRHGKTRHLFILWFGRKHRAAADRHRRPRRTTGGAGAMDRNQPDRLLAGQSRHRVQAPPLYRNIRQQPLVRTFNRKKKPLRCGFFVV